MPTNKVEKLSREQLRKIWTKLTLTDWLSILQEFKPENQWSQRSGEIVGCCIYHKEKAPSFHIKPEKGFAYCFGGSCKRYEHDPIRLLSEVMGVATHQVVRQLKNRYGVSFSSSYTQNISKFDDNDHVKAALYQVMNLELRDALANPTAPEFSYIVDGGLLAWLQQRQIPEDTIHQWPVGVLPTRERLYERLGDEEQIAGGEQLREAAYQYVQKYLALPNEPMKQEGWLAFFYFTSPTNIGRIKLRKPCPGHEFRIIEDPYDDEVGFFGLNMFPELRPQFGDMTLHVTEGDFDALAPIVHQMTRGRSDFFIVGSGGSMDDHLDHLVEFGFKDIRLIQDADEGGIGRAKAWLKNNAKVTGVFKWTEEDASKGVKDIDEAIRAYGFDDFFTRIQDAKSYARNHEWAANQLSEALDKIPSGDVKARTEKAIEYGRVLKNETERNAFVETACQDHGLEKELIVQDLAPDDTAVGFRARLAKALEKVYLFLASDGGGEDTRATVTVWSNRRRMIQRLQRSSRNLAPTIEMDTGPLDIFAQKNVGIPDFILFKQGPKGRDIPRSDLEQTDMLVRYYDQAVGVAADGLLSRTRLEEVGQGVHFLPDTEHEEINHLYLINGDRFFQGTFENESLKFSEMDSPRSGRYLFRVANRPWSTNLKTLRDIEEGSEFDPKDIYRQVHRIIDMGWKFFHHELETTFIAADIIYTSIASIFQNMVFVDITGESHSGKSTLMQVIGGNANPAYRLCESTTVMDNYTSAGIRQFMANNRLRLILDEFEDVDAGSHRPDNKSFAVREILDLVRSAASGADYVRGTSSGEAIRGKINFPMTVGGIYTMQKAQDLNRFVHIRTKQIPGYRYPLLSIQQEFSPTDMKKLRRGLTLCLLPHIPKILKTYMEIQKEFEGNASMAAGTLDRQARNFFPAATILKFVGEDYVKFMTDFSAIKSQEMADFGGTEQEYRRIWNAILHTTINLAQHSKEHQGMLPLSTIIGNRDFMEVLKATDIGAYFIPDKKWLIVFWQRALSGILRYNNEYRNHQNYHRLKIMADQDPRVISRERLTNAFLKNEVWPRTGGLAVSPDDITVIDLSETLASRVTPEIEIVEPIDADEKVRQSLVNDIATDIRPPKRGNF